jgi:hypothetical protein
MLRREEKRERELRKEEAKRQRGKRGRRSKERRDSTEEERGGPRYFPKPIIFFPNFRNNNFSRSVPHDGQIDHSRGYRTF